MKIITIVSTVFAFMAAQTLANAQVKRASDIDKKLAKIALRFHVAEGTEDSCGKACSKWIAVEGEFDKGSAERLMNFIKENMLSALPIFFHSTGGLADEGMAVGRELRSLGMNAGVARSEKSCAEKDCPVEPGKPSAQPVRSSWRSSAARCNSACVFALTGAKQRWVPSDAAVGVHSPAYFCFSDKTGSVVQPIGKSKDAIDCRKKIGERERDVSKFFSDMGVGADLLVLIRNTPNSKMRYLSRQELDRFKIASGEFQKL